MKMLGIGVAFSSDEKNRLRAGEAHRRRGADPKWRRRVLAVAWRLDAGLGGVLVVVLVVFGSCREICNIFTRI